MSVLTLEQRAKLIEHVATTAPEAFDDDEDALDRGINSQQDEQVPDEANEDSMSSSFNF